MKSGGKSHLYCLVGAVSLIATLSATAQTFTNHIYQVIHGQFTWHQAKEDAEMRGGHLATITSLAEAQYVASLNPGFPNPEGYWLGATDEDHEGTWSWVTGEPWNFTYWKPGEPNNLGPENYLTAAIGAGHQWNDWGQSIHVLADYLLEIDDLTCTPHKAKGAAQLVNGFVVGATVSDGGCGYTNPPAVLIKGGGGSGAMAQAVISNGVVVAIQILDAGFSYETPPTIVIGSPPFVPRVGIKVRRIEVSQEVVLGWKYVLETSTNNLDWIATGPAFVADEESLSTEFDVDAVGRFFRLRVVP